MQNIYILVYNKFNKKLIINKYYQHLNKYKYMDNI
jgi:hypothetical protein